MAMQARASRLLSRRGGAGALLRHFHSHSHGHGLAPLAALAEVPAVSQPSGSLFSVLFPKKSVPGPPMFEPLPGVPKVSPLQASAAPSETFVTTLPNGLRIASQDIPGPTATVGVYIDSGSVWETPFTSGVSHVLERVAFKSTSNRSAFRFVREIEAIGGNFLSSASREQTAYTAGVIRTFVPEAVELLADNVRNSLFNDWEVKEQVAKLKAEVASLQTSSPEMLLQEALHSAGYVGALSHPLLAHPASLARISGQQLFDFVAHNYKAPRIVVAAAGVPHSEFVDVVEPLFYDLEGGDPPLAPQSQYVGGDFRMAAESPATHIALGFELQGGWRDEKSSIAAVVFQVLLGGGASFSAGGPGKGLYSRLYRRVLSRFPEVQTCSAFSTIYNDSGLIGIYGTSSSEFIPNLVDIMVGELTAVASPGGVTEEELQRAKNATVASVLMNLESRAVTAEDIGRQILTYGHRKSTESFIDAVNALTPKDITSLAQKLIKTPLSLATYGDVVHVPRFDQVAARFS